MNIGYDSTDYDITEKKFLDVFSIEKVSITESFNAMRELITIMCCHIDILYERVKKLETKLSNESNDNKN